MEKTGSASALETADDDDDGGGGEEESIMKRDLQGLVEDIVEEDDDYATIDKTDQAIGILRALKKLRLGVLHDNDNNRSPLSASLSGIPDEFRCPISKELMRDPVVVATGQTYDRPFIIEWLKDGHQTCPRTQQVLSHALLTPNHLVRQMIIQWCKECHIELPDPIQDPDDKIITIANRDHLNSLLQNMSFSLSNQKMAAKQLRLLTKQIPSIRALFAESSEYIAQLLYPLSCGVAGTDLDLCEDLIATVLNLSVHDDNKKLLAENPLVIPLLIESLYCGTIETRSSAAAALFTLSVLNSNKHIIGKLGAIRPLIDQLEEGHPLATKDAASAILNLCLLSENRERAVREGAVNVVLKKIKNRIFVDEFLAVLAILSSHQKAIEDMEKLGAMACLFGIIKENTCERNKENCIAIIYTLCLSDRSNLWMVWEEEMADGTLSSLAKTGTSRAKRKANGLLERLHKASLFAHSA